MAPRMMTLLTLLMLITAACASYNNKYKASFRVTCPAGKALGSFKSVFSGGDRQYKFECDSNVGSYNIHKECFWTPYVNWWQQYFNFLCPLHSVPAGVYSYYSTSHFDRRWQFRCCFVKIKLVDCHWKSHFVNDQGGSINFRPRRTIVKGFLASYYSSKKDRRWRVYICYKD